MLLTCELVNMSLRAIINILPHARNIPFTWRLYYYHMNKIFHPFGQIILSHGWNILSMWMKNISTWEVEKWVKKTQVLDLLVCGTNKRKKLCGS